MNNEFWQGKIKAFLHDPPDKALILFHKFHEKEIVDIWKIVGLESDAEKLRKYVERRKGLRDAFPIIHSSDVISSSMQRLNIPKEYRMDDARNCNAHICFRGVNKPIFKHTLSGEEEKFSQIVDFTTTYGYEKALDKYGFGPNILGDFLDRNDWKRTYFRLWRFLPEKYDLGYFLPADTRIPDHSIWDHLDVTAAIFSSLEGGLCLFSVKIPAVQEFISHSRKLADLWTGSHIFSTIIFEGIKVIAEELGPDAVIYPQLRGNPMFDLSEFNGEIGKFVLAYEGERLNLIRKENVKKNLHVANFPNTFLSFIPSAKAENIAQRVEDAIKQKWREIANKAKKLLEEVSITVDENLWNTQIENAIELTV